MAGIMRRILKLLLLFFCEFFLGVNCDCDLIMVKSVTPAEDEPSLEFADLSGVLVTETPDQSTLDGNIKILKDFEDVERIAVLVTVCKVKDKRCEIMFTHCVSDMCKYLGNKEDTTYPEISSLGFGCPLKQGLYQMDNVTVDKNKIKVSEKHEGFYDAKIEMWSMPADGDGCDHTGKQYLCTWLTSASVECNYD